MGAPSRRRHNRQGFPSAVPHRCAASADLFPSNKSSRSPRSRRKAPTKSPSQAVLPQPARAQSVQAEPASSAKPRSPPGSFLCGLPSTPDSPFFFSSAVGPLWPEACFRPWQASTPAVAACHPKGRSAAEEPRSGLTRRSRRRPRTPRQHASHPWSQSPRSMPRRPFLIRACSSQNHQVPFRYTQGDEGAAIFRSSVIPTWEPPQHPPLAPEMPPPSDAKA